MTTPTTISRETIGSETFEVARILFHTPRGGCGERRVYTVRPNGTFTGREKLKRIVWEARRSAALEAAR